MWRTLVEKAKVRPIRLHDVRDSCGTALHLRGERLAVIATSLEHADASITARLHAHSQDDELKSRCQGVGSSCDNVVTTAPRCGLLT